MGLLDSVLGSVLAGQKQQSGGLGGLGNVLGGMLGGQQAQQQGPGGLNMGMVAALAPILMSMLANNSQQGGLGGGLLGAVLDQDGDGQLGLGDILKIGGGLLGGKR